MNSKEVLLSQAEVHKLLAAGSGDAALLYLYLQCGNPQEEAETALRMLGGRCSCAMSTLRQMGLWQEERVHNFLTGQPPRYTEADVAQAMDQSKDFGLLVGEVQRVLGRILTTEELKILLSFRNYLDFPPEVVSVLVSYCQERLRKKGSSRNPSLRTIEKEAYVWAEQGIHTMEDAVAYMQSQNIKQSRIHQLQQLLQIGGRNLTAAEERYAQSWLDMDFDSEALQMAYEKTCLNTGGLKWAYMNKILTSWHQQNLHTGAEIRQGDKGPQKGSARTNAELQTQRVQSGTAALGELEREAIARMMRDYPQEGK